MVHYFFNGMLLFTIILFRADIANMVMPSSLVHTYHYLNMPSWPLWR